MIVLAPSSVATGIPPYEVVRIPHARFVARLNEHRISGPLRIVPEPYQSRGFRASGLATCLRQTGYRLLNVTQTDDTYNADNQLAADQGSALHVRIQEQLVGAGMVFRDPSYSHPGRGNTAVELSLKDVATGEDLARLNRWNFSGHMDAVLADTRGDLSIFDLKSGKPELLQPSYEYLPAKLQAYATQTMSYMAHFSAPDGRKATTAYVLMLSRGETRTRALFRIPWQPERWALDAARLDAAALAVKARQLPIAEPERNDCRFCGWRTRCKKGQGE